VVSMIEVKAPNNYSNLLGIKVFLGGSIEMGTAENWQQLITNRLKGLPVVLLNPRRDEWDSTWVRSIENSKFREQVLWELHGLDDSDIIVIYLDPSTKSPISLMELGLHASSGKLIVCCPDGFWRKGNVEIVCYREDVLLTNTIEDLINALITVVNRMTLERFS